MLNLISVGKMTQYNTGLKRANRGFTLIELMVVVVIVAIGVSLALPVFDDISQRRQVTSQAEQLAAFISQAQSEAVKQNQPIFPAPKQYRNTLNNPDL